MEIPPRRNIPWIPQGRRGKDLGIDPSEIKATTFHPDTVDTPYRAGGASPNEGIEVFLMCAHPKIDKDPVRVEIIGDDGIIREEVFKDNRWRKIIIKADELRGSKVLTFQVSRTWNPKLAGISEDSRDLGVAVAVLKEKLLVNRY